MTKNTTAKPAVAKPETATKPEAETPERAAQPASPEAQVDRVAAVSYRADGTPDQSKGFEVLTAPEDDLARD